MSNTEYFPMCIWLQCVDNFGMDIGECLQTHNLHLIHAQIGDLVCNPRYAIQRPEDTMPPHLIGEWTVHERKWSEHGESVGPIVRNLTLYLIQH